MTRDQMHNTLRYVREQLADERGTDFSGVKALDLVLEELEQETRKITYEDVKGYCKPRCLTIIDNELLYELTHPKIKALEQEPSGDAISRQAVEEIINDIRDCISVEGYWAILERLKKLPSIEQEPKTETVTEFADRCRECGAKYGKLLKQEPKTGHWIKQSENVNRCSECELMVIKTSINNYCPNCGARMVEPQKRSNKE